MRLLAALGPLRRRAGDELIVADNTAQGVVASVAGRASRCRIARATAERSSYHARNAGARMAANDWLLFVDSDCVPAPGLLDAYFAEPVPDDCGAVSGLIVGDPAQRGWLPRYARSRSFLSVPTTACWAATRRRPETCWFAARRSRPSAASRRGSGRVGTSTSRAAWLPPGGWSSIGPAAVVAHRHRESLPGFVGMIARYGAGARWLNERYPGSAPRWPLLSGLRGAARDVTRLALRGRLESALFRGVDGLGLIAHNLGYLASNRAPGAD